jgi:hypothetical protein
MAKKTTNWGLPVPDAAARERNRIIESLLPLEKDIEFSIALIRKQRQTLLKKREETVVTLNQAKNTLLELGSVAALDVITNPKFIDNAYYILYGNLARAMRKSVDFNHDVFLSHASNFIFATPGLINLSVSSLNINTKFEAVASIVVTINTDKMGTIDEYANAVKSARAVLHYGTAKNISGDFATDLWWIWLYSVARRNSFRFVEQKDKEGDTISTSYEQTKQYLPTYRGHKLSKRYEKDNAMLEKLKEKYWRIIGERLHYMNQRIPYWYLIEYGNAVAGARMSSNRGGRADSPAIPATHFIEKTAQQIQELAQDYITTKVSEYSKAKGDFQAVGTELSRQISDLDHGINAIDSYLSSIRTTVTTRQVLATKILLSNQNVQNLLNKISVGANRATALAALKVIVDKVLMQQLPPKMRASINIGGMGRLRISLKQLSSIINTAIEADKKIKIDAKLQKEVLEEETQILINRIRSNETLAREISVTEGPIVPTDILNRPNAAQVLRFYGQSIKIPTKEFKTVIADVAKPITTVGKTPKKPLPQKSFLTATVPVGMFEKISKAGGGAEVGLLLAAAEEAKFTIPLPTGEIPLSPKQIKAVQRLINTGRVSGSNWQHAVLLTIDPLQKLKGTMFVFGDINHTENGLFYKML